MLKDLYNPVTAVNVTNSVVHTYSNNESNLNTTLNDGIDQLTFLFPTENILKCINHFFPQAEDELSMKNTPFRETNSPQKLNTDSNNDNYNTLCPSIP